ncbi:hypothetical protein D0T84_01190 [Dysgonomonas sp. 521]|uniref:hypothetical protein n=1 Tax=Dysgonomonas sp. 521 TaxID=2302932 RepID=UPI0013D40859|nr:hypothetical protein [Dysgonomonas sp. 521]NDV93531.1 hypothetical protein [Dysgonomonas sp. 521]
MTVNDIYKIMTDAYISDPEVIARYGLTEGKTFDEQFSAASIERIMFFNAAVAMYVNYQTYTQHTTDIDRKLKDEKVHSTGWYTMMALLFQYGYELAGDTDAYDNSGLTEEQIEASRVVKFAAAVSPMNKSILYIKTATEVNGVKQPLPDEVFAAFKAYILKIQDAGVKIKFINDPADEMRVEMDVYYNPLVLDKNGKRLDGTNDTPVPDAIRNYVHNLIFNSRYANVKLVDAVQAVDGVELPELKKASSRYGVYTDFKEIDAIEIAHAGYYTISDANLILKYIPYE